MAERRLSRQLQGVRVHRPIAPGGCLGRKLVIGFRWLSSFLQLSEHRKDSSIDSGAAFCVTDEDHDWQCNCIPKNSRRRSSLVARESTQPRRKSCAVTVI